MDTEMLLATSRLSPGASSVMVFLFGGLIFAVVLTFAATMAYWHRQRAEAARDSVRSKKPTTAGPTVLAGTVSLDQGPFAVRVAITQHGKEWQNKGAWYITWRETSRQVESRPFHLVLSDGARLRVEPRRDVFLVDALDRETNPTPEERVVAAELTQGEKVTISGLLVWADDPGAAPTGYRGRAGKSLVLRAPRAEPMLISSEPLEQRHRRRAKLHGRYLMISAFVWAASHAIAFGRYDLLSWFGDVVQVEDVRPTTWITRGKNSKTQHYGVTARYRDASGQWRTVDDEVNYLLHLHLARNPDAKVPFRVLRSPELSSVGTRPTISFGVAFFSVLANVFLIVLYAVQAHRSLEWYERRRLVQTVTGRL